MSDSTVPEARPDDLTLIVAWRPGDDGALDGRLDAVNVSDHRVRLSGKPGLIPLGTDGRPLDADCVVTLEGKIPPYVDLDPGRTARSLVGWGGWDGHPCSGRVTVTWPGGRVDVAVDGPAQPTRHGPPTNLYTSWFRLVA